MKSDSDIHYSLVFALRIKTHRKKYQEKREWGLSFIRFFVCMRENDNENWVEHEQKKIARAKEWGNYSVRKGICTENHLFFKDVPAFSLWMLSV